MRKFVVLKPITDGETKKVYQVGEIIELSEKRIEGAKAYINTHIEEVKEPEKKASKKKKEKGE